jgi:hypothetical protein
VPCNSLHTCEGISIPACAGAACAQVPLPASPSRPLLLQQPCPADTQPGHTEYMVNIPIPQHADLILDAQFTGYMRTMAHETTMEAIATASVSGCDTWRGSRHQNIGTPPSPVAESSFLRVQPVGVRTSPGASCTWSTWQQLVTQAAHQSATCTVTLQPAAQQQGQLTICHAVGTLMLTASESTSRGSAL